MSLLAPLNPSLVAQAYHPTTFLERGVAVPFTTPMLAGARARPGERGGLDLIVPNPAGGRGVYVLPWGSITELCRPTVHDTVLGDYLATLRAVTPSAIRKAARAIAKEGVAGRAAVRAASAAERGEADAQITCNFHLLLKLVEQVEAPGECAVPPNQEHPAELERRARRATTRIAPSLGQTTEAIARSLEELAAVLCHAGVGNSAQTARMPRLLQRLIRVQHELRGWAAEGHTEEGTAMANLTANAAELTATCARAMLGEVHAMGKNMRELLVSWLADPDGIARKVARPDWLLDGWEPICALWSDAATNAGRLAALVEMSNQVPVLPREVGDWVGFNFDVDAFNRFHRFVEAYEDWRNGVSAMDLVARNERLRAQALEGAAA